MKPVYTTSQNVKVYLNSKRNTVLAINMLLKIRYLLPNKQIDKCSQFASYGTSEENWYVIDGEIVKYLNGKKL